MSEVQIDRRLWTAMKKIVERTENPVYELEQTDRIVLWATPKDKPKSWPDYIGAMRDSVPSCTSAGRWTLQKRDGRLITVKRTGNSISPGLVGIDKACEMSKGKVYLVGSSIVRDLTQKPEVNMELVGEGWVANRRDSVVGLQRPGAKFNRLKKRRNPSNAGIRCEPEAQKPGGTFLESRDERTVVLRGEEKDTSPQAKPRKDPRWDDFISELWVLQKWAELREKALDSLSHQGVVPVCPLCEEWKFDRSARR